VVWAVRSVAIAKRIYATLKKAEPESIKKHNFIFVGDLLKQGWSATFVMGTERGKTLREKCNKTCNIRATGVALLF